VLGAPVIETLVEPALWPLVRFAIRNHDFIKDVTTGEVPTGFIAEQLAELPAGMKDAAMLALGMVQVAGAASLGEGGLEQERIEIFRSCWTGRILSDQTAETRLARLLRGPAISVSDGDRAAQAAYMLALPQSERTALHEFLDGTILHGWPEAVTLVRRRTPAEEVERSLLVILMSLGEFWRRHPAKPLHVMISREAARTLVEHAGTASAENGTKALPGIHGETIRLLNGEEAVILHV
jgi:hypothetical protein